MDTRRSKSASDSKNTCTPPNEDGGEGNVENQDNSSPEQESVSESVDSKVAEAPDSTSPNQEKSGMVTRSVGKSVNKEVKSKKENVGKRSPAKSKAASLSESTRDSPELSSESPQPKRRKTDKQSEIDYMELSGNNDESSQDDDSSSGDQVQMKSPPAGNSQESTITSGEKSKASVTTAEQDVKINASVLKTGKAPLIKVKKVVKGANEGEINVVTSYEAHSGPGKMSLPSDVIPQSAKKYMILDKATIKEMMEKGLVQTIKKDGTNQTIATYRAVVPKGETSFLNKLASASLSSLPPVLNINSVSQPVGPSKPIGNPALSTTFKPVSGTSTLISSLPSVPSKSLMTILTSSTAPSLVSSATTMTSSGTAVVPSSGVKIQIPPATLANGKASSVPQVITSPIFVKTPATSTAGKQGNLQVVAFPPDILQQLQRIQKSAGSSFSVSASSTTSGKPIFTIASGSQQGVKVFTRGGTVATAVSNTDNPNDLDLSPCVEISDDSGEEAIAKQKETGKYGVPTGACKVLKSMKMYEFVDKNKQTGVPPVVVNKTGNTNVRWLAVPNKPGEPKSAGGAPNLPATIPIRFSTSGKDSAGSSQLTIPSESQLTGGDELYTHYKIQELRAKQKEQLSFHRKRYLELLRTYNELANKYNEIKDVGTMKQILTDAKKYMKKDHILFFRNEMMLHDRLCNGNRYSPKFMMMLMKYYNRSHIGYRFLRRIFTLPAVRTLITWQNKKLPLKKKKSALNPQEHLEITVNGNNQGILYTESQPNEGTGTSSQLPDHHLGASLKSTGDDSESYCDSDSELEEFDEDSIEINSNEIHKTVDGGHHSSNSGVLMEFDEH